MHKSLARLKGRCMCVRKIVPFFEASTHEILMMVIHMLIVHKLIACTLLG